MHPLIATLRRDVRLNAINWGDIVDAASNSAQSIAGLGPGVSVTLSIIRTSGNTGFVGRWVKNGSGVGSVASVDSAQTVSVVNGDTLAWQSGGSGGPLESATLTVTNVTDGGRSVDTFVVSTSI